MKSNEIVELVKQSNPNIFGKLSDAKAAKIVAAALREISKQVGSSEESVVKVAGLGNFKVRQVEREKEGEKVVVKKILFNAAKAK